MTHLCATVFVFLAGTSAWLRGARAGGSAAAAPADRAALSRYLATRGALLVVLEVTWVSFSWQFGYSVVVLQVIWALGMGMLALSVLIWLPRWAIAGLAALLIGGHNALDGWHPGGPLWLALHERGYRPLADNFGIAVAYPLLPWLGLIAAGYAAGPLFGAAVPPGRRQRRLWAAAGVLMLTFVLLRSGNVYGDPGPWSAQGRGWMADLMSFARVHKYPPSLQYLLVTGSIGLALLALFERVNATSGVLRKPAQWLLLFGRTPLFFYLVHVALIHSLGNAYFALRFGGTPDFGGPVPRIPDGYQPSLAVVYLAWLCMLLIMYALTRLWLRWRTTQRP